MSDFELARESCEERYDYNVLISEYENGAEQRRLKNSSYPLAGFKIKTPFLVQSGLLNYKNFFISKFGALNSFTFTSPFDNIEYIVRFEPESFRTIFTRGLFQSSFDFRILP